MNVGLDWSVALSTNLCLHYVNQGGIRSIQDVIVRRLDWRETGGGNPRIVVSGLARADNEHNRAVKTFLLHRVTTAIDLASGEVFEGSEIATLFARMVKDVDGPQPPRWITVGAYPMRVTDEEIDIVFGEDGLAENWFFAVPKAFRSALDIVKLPATSLAKWSRGVPPSLDFTEGDHFHAPSMPRDAWERQRKWQEWTLQIHSVFNEEWLCFALREWKDGNNLSTTYKACSQEVLEQVLRFGPIMWHLLPSSEKPFRAWPPDEALPTPP